jgi:site-specific DNA-methyltransferase (adenine-specific)
MAVNIEDAGFEIRDMIAWVYGSGFPKSLDVSKAIDKAAGAEREVIGTIARPNSFDDKGEGGGGWKAQCVRITAPATPDARQWNGWGTALKPALEPITMARKPPDGTVAENVLKHGTGAINVDGSRVGTEPSPTFPARRNAKIFNVGSGGQDVPPPTGGRWPANLIHDGSEEVVGLFPETGGGGTPKQEKRRKTTVSFCGNTRPKYTPYFDTASGGGSAARFFYCAKADKADRDDGNHHPTVKPVDLMRYLVTLVCREGGTVLDPFMGSGTTGIACIRSGRKFIGIERDARYFEIARQRLLRESAQPDLFFSLSPLPSA